MSKKDKMVKSVLRKMDLGSEITVDDVIYELNNQNRKAAKTKMTKKDLTQHIKKGKKNEK